MKKLQLTILETSDIHGNIYPIQYGTNEPDEIGMGKIATLIKQERKKNEHTILIENGDLIQGTPLTYHFARQQHDMANPMIIWTNALQYDAGVFGNHEFNYGQELLHQSVEESAYPWLSANILNESQEPFYGKPYILKEVLPDLRVAVLGLTTPYIPNWEQPDHIKGMIFEDAVVSAQKWVPYLKNEEKADIVIVAYHGGFERDLDSGEPTETLTGENQGYQLCMEVPGIDVLLTGHQHRQISGKSINGVVVVQPGNNGVALGKVTLELEKTETKWVCTHKESMLLSTSGVPADEELLEKTMDYENKTQEWLDQPIGKINGDMLVHDPMKIRTEDNPLIEFINRVQMDAAGVDISNTALFDNKSKGFPKNVTMRDVVSNYIYPNTLKVIRISGKDMKAALERSAAYFQKGEDGEIKVNPAFSTPKPQHYNYDMWEGIDYLIDISKPEGQRIVKLQYHGKPVTDDDQFDVVMNNYRSGGGGEYEMYKGKPVIKDIPIDVSELIANYILKHKTIEPALNHNWKVIRG